MRAGGALTVLLFAFFVWRMFRAESAATSQEPGVRRKVWHKWSGFAALMIAPAGLRRSPSEIDIMYMALFWLSVVLFLGIAVRAMLFRLALPL